MEKNTTAATIFSGLRRKWQRWRKKNAEVVVPSAAPVERLDDCEHAELLEKLQVGERRCVAMTVGRIDYDGIVPAAERFRARAELFREPCMAGLLRESKQQFEYVYGGVLRIPCDGDHFRRVIESGGCANMVSYLGYDV